MEAILSGGTAIQRSDSVPAHTRLMIALVIVMAAVLSLHPLSFGGYFLLACLLWIKSPMDLTTGLKRLLLIDGVVILTVMPLPFSYVDQQFIHWGPLALSEAGVVKAVEIFAKATISAIVMMSQCSGMSGLELSKALHRLKVPAKFILLLQFSIRYISVMQQELFSLRTSMRARGFGNGPLLHNWKNYGYLFGMLLIRALARADRIWLAMKCRGYNGYFPLTGGEPTQETSRNTFVWFSVVTLIFLLDLSLARFGLSAYFLPGKG